ncbi:F-box/kelch-repeat protein At4g39560-like [Brassica rapa]|uniref:F-box/kelch-repeat protein At4g39560-like n=1 Tax=Brassica campestris TaxID=3711 RepID=UPI00142D4CF5|nr:F-box/kelch-repeat protein At4g39560-like [Brassica rapa]
MKGRCTIQGCSRLALKTRKNETKKVCGLWSLPDDVFVDCLAQVSRLDLVALAMVSRRHRFYAVSTRFWALRYRMGNVDPYLYVFMHMHPDPSPCWFVLHPMQRRLKRINLNLYPATPVTGSCFVKMDLGIYTIGGLINGKPTSEVTFLNCIEHTVYRITPMKMARSGASASLIEDGENKKKKKIYVFGGCWDVADSSNCVEVYDIETGTWELLSVSTPKMPLKIKESMVMDEKHVYAVDEDGEIFVFLTSKSMFCAEGEKETNLRRFSAVVSAGEYCGVCRVSLVGRKSRVWKSCSSNTLSNSAPSLSRGWPSSGKPKVLIRFWSFGMPRLPSK